MKTRLSIALAMAVAASALVGVGSASAATVFGSGCAANQIKEGAVWISTGHSPASPFPVTAPISGVLTEWTVNTNLTVESEGKLAGEFPRVLQQRLVVVRPEGQAAFKVVGEATGGSLSLKGSNTYTARIPVQTGDYLGIAGNPYAAYCATGDEADTFADSVGGTPVGSTVRVETAKGLQVPITARVEPDVDGDGYGDETQDRCPQSAAYQTPCPVVMVSSLSLSGVRAVSVYVTTGLATPVAVSGSVNLGKGRKATLSAPSKTITPGTLGRFQLPLTRPVWRTLKALTPKKALTLTISVSGTNVTGSPSVATSKLSLRGRRKTIRRRNVGHAHHRGATKGKAKQAGHKHPRGATPKHHQPRLS